MSDPFVANLVDNLVFTPGPFWTRDAPDRLVWCAYGWLNRRRSTGRPAVTDDGLIRHSMHLRAEDVRVATAAHGRRLVITAGRARVAISGDTPDAVRHITRRAVALTHPVRCAACDTRLAAGDTHDHPDHDRPVCWECCPDCHPQENQ